MIENSDTRADLLEQALTELERVIEEKDKLCREAQEKTMRGLSELERRTAQINMSDVASLERESDVLEEQARNLLNDRNVLFSARFLKAEVLFFRGDFDGAVDSCSAVLEASLDPSGRAAVHLHVGKCRAAQGRHADAAAAYRAALAVIPESDLRVREVFAGCAAALVEVGDLDRARDAAEAAIEMNRYYPGAYDPLVLAARRAGDLAGAAGAAQRAVLYETPWDEANRAAVVARAAECVRAWSESE